MRSTLWIFGDSFCNNSNEEYHWTRIIQNKFIGSNYCNIYCDGRDTQTIMDLFYRNLYKIKKNDLVLFMLPSLARVRYPKEKSLFRKVEESDVDTNIDSLEYDSKELFYHWPFKDYPDGEARDGMEFPFNTFNYRDLSVVQAVTYEYDTDDGKQTIREQLKFGFTPLDFSKLLVANKAVSENWFSIINSLNKTFDFKLDFYSWTDEYKSNVYGKNDIESQIGFWHTKHDDFIESDGIDGKEWDGHFSKKMNKAFSELVITRNKQFFI